MGAYWFAAGDEVEVEVALSGPAEPGRVLRADAIRFVFGGETTTAVPDSPPPTLFRLGPNHPNPAHGATSFDYVVAEPSEVRIRLFDVLGREVALLAEAHQPAGTYTNRVDVSGLPSGLYFCRMEAGEFTTSRTWVVVR